MKKMFKVLALICLVIVADCSFADDIIDNNTQESAIQNVVAAQAKISQAYDRVQSYYTYCEEYAMWGFDNPWMMGDDPWMGYDPWWGYGIPVFDNEDEDYNCVYGVDASNYYQQNNTPTPKVTYSNIHDESNGEVVFDQ